ncbi:hypothetical protein ES702_01127 [subsurface metagenome]
MNGHSVEEAHQPSLAPARPLTPSSHLGKRKRSQSPEKPVINGTTTHTTSPNPTRLDANVDNIIREIRG